MGILSRAALQKKREYNVKRNKELTKTFSARLPKEEYQELCEYLQQIGMNKADFVRWAFDKLRED
jgi:predicted DNA-binding protein